MKRIILASTLLTAVTAVAVMAGSAHAATADAAVAAPVLSMSAVATTSSYGASVSWDVSAPWWTDSCSVTNDTYSWHRGDTMTSECTVATQVQVRSIVTAHGSVYRAGFHTSARSSGAYQAGGNCNTSRDGWDGRISTCLWAHASLSYTLTLPRGTTFNSISHSVSAGITKCHGRWSTSHKRGTHTWVATFTHGNRSGFSQCDIENTRLHYSWRKHVTRLKTITAQVNATAVVQ